MKLTTMLLLAAVLQVSARTDAQTVTYSGKSVKIENVLTAMTKQTGYVFSYWEEDIAGLSSITVSFQQTPLDVALNEALKGKPLKFTIQGKTVFISKVANEVLNNQTAMLAPPIDVRGRTVNAQGEPLAGVTVTVKGSKKGTATNTNGEFMLIGVDESAVLVFSGINVETYEIRVAGRSDLAAIKLTPRVETATEVIVTVNNGYQTLSKERSAGSFGKPDMKVVADRTTSTNILQRLDGLIPGLVLNNSNPTGQVQVRGLTTIPTGTFGANTSPLYVVDGLPITSLDNINPDDVDDVTLLKDATAASIWGSRAANGVIIITTKRGQRNNKVTGNYRGFVSFLGKPDLEYAPYLSSNDYVKVAEELFNTPSYLSAYPYANVSSANAGGMAPHDVILYNFSRGLITEAQKRASLDSLGAIDNRDQTLDLWYRNAINMNQTFSVQGGGSKYNFYGSGNFSNPVSNAVGSKNRTYQLQLNQEWSVGQFVTLRLLSNLNYGITSTKAAYAGRDFSFLPYQLYKDAAGNNISTPSLMNYSDIARLDYQTRSRINLNYNALDELDLGWTKGNNLSTRNLGTVIVKLFKGLRFEGTYGFERATTKLEAFSDQDAYNVRQSRLSATQNPATPGGTPVYNFPLTGGTYDITNGYSQNYTIRNTLNYDNSWKDGLHQVILFAGQEAQEQKRGSYRTRARGWNPDLLLVSAPIDWARLQGGISNLVTGGTNNFFDDTFLNTGEYVTRFTSYFGNAGYTFNRKYTINGSIRADKSNLFGLDKSAQNKPVWSVGGRWAVSEEKFMNNVEWLPNLALRFTYGIAGNAPDAGTAASDDILNTVTNSFVPGVAALNVLTPANRTLTWERTATKNLGIDFTALKSRIYGSLDLYHKVTNDLLGDVVLNYVTGYSNVIGNVGKLENKGIELNLNTVNVISRSFRWGTNLNFAYNRNKIVELNPGTPITTAEGRIGRRGVQGQQFVNGYAAYALWAYQYAGLDNLGDPQVRTGDGTITKAVSGNSIPQLTDVKYAGTQQPKWTGGLGNTFSYQRFTLSANTVFNFGHVMRNDVNTFFAGRLYGSPTSNGSFGAGGNVHTDFLSRWKQPGDEARTNIPSYVPVATASQARRNLDYYYFGDINVLNASYIKMRDISLSYNLPSLVIQKLGVQQIRIYANINNILLWTANDEGIDPEYGFGFGPNSFVANTFTRSPKPKQATISFGLNVGF